MKTGLPIIRAGQRKPYTKATRQQIDERRGFVARLLRAGKTKSQIHRAVREQYNVEWRQCDRYILWLTDPRGLASLRTATEQRCEHGSPAPAHYGLGKPHAAHAIKAEIKL